MNLRSIIAILVMAGGISPLGYADQQLMNCRGMVDTAMRLACYDDLVDARYSADHAAVSTQKQKQAQTQSEGALVQSAEARFGQPVVRQDEREEIAARVVDLDKTAYNKLLVTLDNKQVWQQLDSSRLRLAVDDVVTIRASSLRSFQLRKASGGKSIRVKRIR
ncbi:MAG: hypothetical protein RIC89_20930 [Pseudomonadales bacterium]